MIAKDCSGTRGRIFNSWDYLQNKAVINAWLQLYTLESPKESRPKQKPQNDQEGLFSAPQTLLESLTEPHSWISLPTPQNANHLKQITAAFSIWTAEMLITETHMQLPPRAHGIPGWFGLEGTLRITQGHPSTPGCSTLALHTPRDGAPQPLGSHLFHKMRGVEPKREQSEAAARPQPVTVTKWSRLPKNPRFWICCCALPRSKPSGAPQQQLQKQQGRIPASRPRKVLTQRSFFSLLFFFPRYSFIFAEKCLEVYLSFRSCIRHKNIDASVEQSIREWSMLSGPWTKLPFHCSRKCSFAITDG